MSQGKLLSGAVLGALAFGYLSVFTVAQTEKAIKFRLGEIMESDIEPGLHFQIPLINNVKKFDARLLTMNLKPGTILTSEKKNVEVDSFVTWRIKDVGRFYAKVAGGDINQANILLEQNISSRMRNEFSKHTIRELVSAVRGKIRDLLIEDANVYAKELGIEIQDIRVARVDLPEEVRSSVHHRMEAERARVARDFRARGAEAAMRIRADADRQSEVLQASAFRDAETLRGEGDAAAAEIYARAYSKDPEFFAFYRSLNAYRNTFRNKESVLVMDPDSDFFHYFGKEKDK